MKDPIIKRPWDIRFEAILDKIVADAPGYTGYAGPRKSLQNFGITLQVYSHYLGRRATYGELEHMSPLEAKKIYWRLVIKPMGLDMIDNPALIYLTVVMSNRFGALTMLRLLRQATKWPLPKDYRDKTQFRISPQEQAYTNILPDQWKVAAAFYDNVADFVTNWYITKPRKRIEAYGHYMMVIKSAAKTFNLPEPYFRDTAGDL